MTTDDRFDPLLSPEAREKIRRMAEPARRREISEASRRQQWRNSPERRKALKAHVIGNAIVWPGFLLLGLLTSSSSTNSTLASVLVGAAMILAVTALLLQSRAYMRWQKRAFLDRLMIEEEEARDNKEAQLVGQDETDIAELWKLTNDRLRGYHERAYRQADQSFRNAQIAIFGGFIIIAGTAGIAAWKTSLSTPSSIVIGVVGTVGAGLAAYIGRTFLRLQETTASHMRSYFDQPQETFRYLVAEKLIERLPEDQRAATVEYLVQAVMLSGVTIEQAQAALNPPQAEQQKGQTDAGGQGAAGTRSA